MAASINKQCYCQVVLHEDDDEDPVKGWTCRSCCRLIKERVNFWCRNGECIYRQITSGTYMICSDCFNAAEGDEPEQKEQNVMDNGAESNQFAVKKMEISLEIIR